MIRFFCSIAAVFMVLCSNAHGETGVKMPGLAGSWYPGDKAGLSRMLDGFLSGAGDVLVDGGVGVIISPHAGYVFSGPVAAYGFKATVRQEVKVVIILAPTHNFDFEGAAVWPDGKFRTPLGDIEVDGDLAEKILAADPRFVARRDVFQGGPGRPENSVETQIPFVQKVFPGAKIVPVIMGYQNAIDVARKMAQALISAVGDRRDVLLDVSVDQSHFHPDVEARVIDKRGIDAIERMDIQAFLAGHRDGVMEVDGFPVVATGMLYARDRGFDQVKVLKYGTSADMSGDRSRVVGYASIVFYRAASAETHKGGAPLTDAEKKRLLEIARQTVDTFVKTGKAPEFHEMDPRLQEEEGAFVTLHRQGRLRGCIGNIIGQGPLYQTVRDMAVAAASEDPRFSPVKPGELPEIEIEISVLSAPVAVASADEIKVGTHGVIVSRGPFRRGVFLPQVAEETGWDRDTFLSELCSQKAGLPGDAWKDPGTRLEVFTADVFGEKK